MAPIQPSASLCAMATGSFLSHEREDGRENRRRGAAHPELGDVAGPHVEMIGDELPRGDDHLRAGDAHDDRRRLDEELGRATDRAAAQLERRLKARLGERGARGVPSRADTYRVRAAELAIGAFRPSPFRPPAVAPPTTDKMSPAAVGGGAAQPRSPGGAGAERT